MADLMEKGTICASCIGIRCYLWHIYRKRYYLCQMYWNKVLFVEYLMEKVLFKADVLA